MEELYAYRQRLLKRFAEIVDDFRTTMSAIPAGVWQNPHVSGDESPHRVLAHLREVEAKAFHVRLRRILDEDEPFLPLFDDEHWMESSYRPDESPEAILNEYARLRQQELSWLENLPPQAWNRTARHPWWGIRALQWWVEQSLAYAEDHLRQMKHWLPPGAQ